jgi:glutathione S-transferase
MITLYTFGPAFDLPDPSPFVTKAEVLLKMAGLPYRTDTSGFSNAPKGKLPYIDDDGTTVADSTFIRRHIEKKYGFDFDAGLSAEQRATAWAFEKMAENHLYWTVVEARWLNDENFNKGPASFFQGIPVPVRAIIVAVMRRKMRHALKAHGIGRHTADQIVTLGSRDIDAIADYLGPKPFFMGAEPTGADATMFAFAAGTLCPTFETPLRIAAERHANLRSYVGRMTARYYPDHTQLAGCPAAA